MFLNGSNLRKGWADEVDDTADQRETFSIQATLNLKKGDKIDLLIYSITAGVYLVVNYYTQFSGYLLEENITLA